MKCKNCGGEFLYKNGTYLCNSCGATFSLDGIYENIDVCICYEENDSAGRRTRDSVIAQEVYRKLEESKIATFYERVSADGMAGDELESCKIAAINKAKIVIVLGTSVEAFTTIQEKYMDYLKDKTIIPFCIDVNPGAIPKTLSKIQAMSYSTIGWDKDLIKGVYNILGRELSVDTSVLYNRRRNKIIIVCISTVIVIALAVTGWFLLKSKDTNNDTSSTNETSATETKPMSQKEIYDTANGLMDQGDFIGALQLFSQIPDYSNSTNLIKLIYEKFEGYYWDEENNLSLHLTISGNKKANVEISYNINDVYIKITESGQIEIDTINFQYIDSENNNGKLTLYLSNEKVTLNVYPDESTEISIKEKEIEFLIVEKSDQPHAKIADANTLLDWANKKVSISEILRLGFELEEMGSMFADSRGIEAYGYKIKNTDIQLLTVLYGENSNTWFNLLETDKLKQDDRLVLSILAPASIILPDKIGKTSAPFIYNNCMFAPYGEYSSYPGISLSIGGNSTQKITADTPVCFISKNNIQQDIWDTLYEDTIGEHLCGVQIQNDIDTCRDGMSYKSRRADILAQSDNNILIVVSREVLDGNLTLPYSAAYYSVSKQTYKATLIYEYNIPESGRNSYEHWDIWENYPNLFGEFID